MKDRILKIIDFYKLNSAAFAVKVGIQNSQLSHIKSGRNEPSLDIVKKILEKCPEISSDWLIFGTGDMVKNAVEKTVTQPIKPQKEPIQLSIDGLFETNSSNDTNQETEFELKPSSETPNSTVSDDSSMAADDSAKNSQSSNVSTPSEPQTSLESQKSSGSNTVQSEVQSSSQPSTANIESQPQTQTKADNNPTQQSSVVNSSVLNSNQDNREIGISLTKQELLDLLLASQHSKSTGTPDNVENTPKKEKTPTQQTPRINKIIVYYSDKSYEEFMPAL